MYHNHTFKDLKYITMMHNVGFRLCLGFGYAFLTLDSYHWHGKKYYNRWIIFIFIFISLRKWVGFCIHECVRMTSPCSPFGPGTLNLFVLKDRMQWTSKYDTNIPRSGGHFINWIISSNLFNAFWLNTWDPIEPPYSLPSINVNPREWIKVNIYRGVNS
jgi:hypothetical protein